MNEAELQLRRRIFEAFAETGSPPDVSGEDPAVLARLERAHVIVRDAARAIRMANPFAGHREGARVDAGGRTWWGNCAWDAFGIVAALGLADATITAQEVTLRVRDGQPAGDAIFHVEVPAARWWDDVGYT